MARGYYRKQRYIIRTKDGRGIGASSVAQVKKLASQYEIDYIETETGDMRLEQFLDGNTGRCSAIRCGAARSGAAGRAAAGGAGGDLT